MFAVAYVSTAVRRPSTFDLEHLLVDARTFNARVHVTGALLLHDVTFFQYFEGPGDAVREVYERIKISRLHRDIVELLYEEVPARCFDAWHMGFADAPQGTVLALSHAHWGASLEAAESASTQSDGITLLLDFWRRSRREVDA